MTIYFRLPIKDAQIKRDLFILHEPTDKEDTYHFSGVSLVGDKYELNSINIARYYALGPDFGIRVERDRVSLVQHGKETATIPGNFAGHMQPPSIWAVSEKLDPAPPSAFAPFHLDCWPEIKQHLRNQPSTNTTAAQMLSEIARWESCSVHTLQLVRDVLVKKISPFNTLPNEIYAADQQWLVYNFILAAAVIGSGEDVWGIVDLKSLNMRFSIHSVMATPLHNGWAIRLPQYGAFLLKDKHHVRVQPVAIPAGSWSRHGPWVFWPQEGDVFLPDQRLALGIILLPHEMIGATQNLAFLSPVPGRFYSGYQPNSPWGNQSQTNANFIAVVNRQGKVSTINATQRYGRNPLFYFGNKSVFVLKEVSQDYFLAIEDTSGQSSLLQQRELKLFSSEKYGIDAMHVVAGSPDIFIILFTSYSPATNYLGLISASGKAFLLPQELYNPWPRGCAIFMEQVDNIIHICFVDSPEKQPGPIVTLEILKGGRFRVLLSPDTAIEKDLREIPPSGSGTCFENLVKGQSQPPKQKRTIQTRHEKGVKK